MELSAQGFNFQTHIPHYLFQIVGPHMRILHVGDILVSAMLVELLKHKVVVFAVNIGVELAVGECAGATLAKLNIGVGVERFGIEKIGNRALAVLNFAAPLQNNRFGLATGEVQCGEHARGPEADHHGAKVVFPHWIFHFHRRFQLRNAIFSQKRGTIVGQGNGHLVIVHHLVFLTGVDSLPEHAEILDILVADVVLLANRIFHIGVCRYRDSDIGEF